jgi:hypothetical protein
VGSGAIKKLFTSYPFHRFFWVILPLGLTLVQTELTGEVQGKVVEVTRGQNILTADFGTDDHGILEGQFVMLSLPGGYSCRLPVIKVIEEKVSLGTLHCPKEEEIQKGMTVVSDPYGDDRTEYPPRPFLKSSANEFYDRLLVAPQPKPPQPDNLKSEIEGWYLHWGAGVNSMQRSSRLESRLASIATDDSLSQVSFHLDALGVYFPRPNLKTLLGSTYSILVDKFSHSTGSFQMFHHQLSGSVMHFFGVGIGEGWFLRVDIGPALMQFAVQGDGLGRGDSESYLGMGGLLGGGHAFPLSRSTRLTVAASAVVKWMPQGLTASGALTVGILL